MFTSDLSKKIINNNSLFVDKTTEEKVIDTKLSIISLAYTPSLTSGDLKELSEILNSIAFNIELNKKARRAK